jgi:hypothetical protein
MTAATGCATKAVRSAAGLHRADLLAREARTPQQAPQTAPKRATPKDETAEHRAEHAAALLRVQKLDKVLAAIEGALARQGDNSGHDAFAEMYDSALSKLRAAQSREIALRK